MKNIKSIIMAFVCAYLIGCQFSIPGTYAWPKPQAIDRTELDAYIAAAKQAEKIEDMVERCLAYPDIPGQQWYKGYSDYRCNLQKVEYPRFDEIKKLFDDHGASGLERAFSQALKAQYRDVDRVEPLFILMDIFDSSQRAYELASDWYEQTPDSAFAQAALGSTLRDQASEARGGASIRNTPDENIQEMHRLLQKAIPLLQSALDAEPRLSPVCTRLMWAARMEGDHDLYQSAESHCARVNRLSYYVTMTRIDTNDPRWGGSFEEVDAIVDEISSYIKDSPRLSVFLGAGIGVRTEYTERFGPPMSLEDLFAGYQHASNLGPHTDYLYRAGDAARKRGDMKLAFMYMSQALRFAPSGKYYLWGRTSLSLAMKDYPQAESDARKLVADYPDDAAFRMLLANALRFQAKYDEGIAELRQAMKDPRYRRDASIRLCETQIVLIRNAQEADVCTRDLIAQYPDYAEVVFMRSWVLYEAGRADQAKEYSDRFYQLVDRNVPRHQQLLKDMSRWTGRNK